MPWNEVSTVTLRAEFVRLAQNNDANISKCPFFLSKYSDALLEKNADRRHTAGRATW